MRKMQCFGSFVLFTLTTGLATVGCSAEAGDDMLEGALSGAGGSAATSGATTGLGQRDRTGEGGANGATAGISKGGANGSTPTAGRGGATQQQGEDDQPSAGGGAMGGARPRGGAGGGSAAGAGGRATSTTGAGGAPNAGTTAGRGGATSPVGGAATGGSRNPGGVVGLGGSRAAGGALGVGGARPAGGTTGLGGTRNPGGPQGVGGARPATGGSMGVGGARPATGGSMGVGGATNRGGLQGTGGAPSSGAGNGSVTMSCPGAVPAGASSSWCSCDQWGQWANGDATFYNDIWGSGAGAQCIWANASNQWGVAANHPNTGGIKSYANISFSPGKAISAVNAYSSSFDVVVPSSGSWETAYDVWVKNGNRIEIMLWMNQSGAVGPIATKYDGSGKAVPDVSNVNVGGHTWNVYYGTNGSNDVVSLIRTANTNSGTVDIKAILNWIISNKGSFNTSWTLDQVQFGFEITSDATPQSFVVNRFSVSSN